VSGPQDKAANVHRGTCFCGSVEIEASGPPLEMGYCHCSSCRFYSGGPASAYILWPADAVRVAKGAELVGSFNKAGISDRRHCTRCGGHLLSFHPALGLTDVKPAIMREMVFEPELHLNYAEAMLPMNDGLPKLKDFPSHAGGSGETMAE
jgi:hypothetical protein